MILGGKFDLYTAIVWQEPLAVIIKYRKTMLEVILYNVP
jgi:hypothetical protein